LWMAAQFADLEDVIQLSHDFQNNYEAELSTALYYYKENYYLYVELSPQIYVVQDDILSQILEYCNESEVTYHLLAEYGQVIFRHNVFENVRTYFTATI